MSFHLILYRLKAEWLRILLGLAFAVILFSWSGTINIISDPVRSFNKYIAYAQTVDRYAARSAGMPDPKPAANSDLRAGYEQLLRNNRGFIYAVLVMSVNDPIPTLIVNALAVLLLTGLFQKQQLSTSLAAGYSRVRVFLSLTAGYYLSVVLVWAISSTYLLNRYMIEFAPEDQGFFLATRLTWFCAFLWHASIAYLLSMLLRRPLPAFLSALALWFTLSRVMANAPNILPAFIISNGYDIPDLLPGYDIGPLLRTDVIAAGFFLLVLIVGWFSFRKRGFE